MQLAVMFAIALGAVTPAAAAPPVRTLARAEAITAIALDATHVYFATHRVDDGASVFRVSRAGGAVEELAAASEVSALAVTPHHVWWRGKRGIERAAKRTRKPALVIARAPEGMAHLVAAGRDVWFTAAARDADGALGQRLHVIRREGTVATEVARLPRGSLGIARPEHALIADGGVVVIAQHPLGVARVDRGRLVKLFGEGTLGPDVAVGGRWIVTAFGEVVRRGLDGSAPRTVATGFLVGSGFIGAAASAGPLSRASTSAWGRHVDDLAGGGGRIVLATSMAERREPVQICGSCVTQTLLQPGTGQLAVLDERGQLVPIVTGEEPIAHVTVDRTSVAWVSDGALRFVDR